MLTEVLWKEHKNRSTRSDTLLPMMLDDSPAPHFPIARSPSRVGRPAAPGLEPLGHQRGAAPGQVSAGKRVQRGLREGHREPQLIGPSQLRGDPGRGGEGGRGEGRGGILEKWPGRCGREVSERVINV